MTAEARDAGALRGWVRFSPAGAGDGAGAEVVQRALRAMPRGLVDRALDTARREKAVQRHEREWRVPEDRQPGQLVHYLEFHSPEGSLLRGTGRATFELVCPDGRTVHWDLALCVEPGCVCDEVMLDVGEILEEGGELVLQPIGRVFVGLDLTPKWSRATGDVARLRSLFPTWRDHAARDGMVVTAWSDTRAAAARTLRPSRPAPPSTRAWARPPPRNAPCPCGSGKRFKGCGGRDATTERRARS